MTSCLYWKYERLVEKILQTGAALVGVSTKGWEQVVQTCFGVACTAATKHFYRKVVQSSGTTFIS